MERDGPQLLLPYDLGIYDPVFYQLRMEYLKTNDSKLSTMEKQLEALQETVNNCSTSKTVSYEPICAQARLMTETACSSLLSLFPELKAKILVLLEDPSSSTYTQIQNFGAFFQDKQTSDPYLFANGKKLVQYLNMLRQIGNLATHTNTAEVNVFDAVTTILSSIQVALLLLGFSMKLNPFGSQFSIPSMDITYHQPSQHQLFQQSTLFQQTPTIFSPHLTMQQPIQQHAPTLSQPQRPHSQLPQQLQQHHVLQHPQPQQKPSQQGPQPPSYQQMLLQQPYLAVLTRPAPPQSQPQPQSNKENGHHHAVAMHNGHTPNGFAIPNGTHNSNSTSNPQKYETSHLWVRNVDIAIDKGTLAGRFQAQVSKDMIQNTYVNTPEIENPCYYTAYINFKNVDAATRAKNALDGVMLGTRKVSIQFNECPALLKKGKMCTSCKIHSEQKGKVVWSKYWVNNSAGKRL